MEKTIYNIGGYNIGGNVTNLGPYFAQFRRLGDPHH